MAVWAIEASCAFLFRVETRTRATRMGISLRAVQPVWNAADSVHSRFDVVKFQAVHKSYTISICSAVHRVSIGQGSTLPAGRSECAQFMSHGRANTVLRCEEKKMSSPPTTKCVQRPELIGLFWTKVTRAFETSRQ